MSKKEKKQYCAAQRKQPLVMKRTTHQAAQAGSFSNDGNTGNVPISETVRTAVGSASPFHIPHTINPINHSSSTNTASVPEAGCRLCQETGKRGRVLSTTVDGGPRHSDLACTKCTQAGRRSEASADCNRPLGSGGQGVPANVVKAAPIVSKAALLQGEPDDDEINIPAFSFENDETFEDVMIVFLENEIPSSEQLTILRQAFVDGCFSKTVKDTPIVTKEPVILKVNELYPTWCDGFSSQ
jgi:hypothetical protein